jgi:hypothetical protein
MKTIEILERLKEISNIANYQSYRLKDKNAVNKELILKQSLVVIVTHIKSINSLMETKVKDEV